MVTKFEFFGLIIPVFLSSHRSILVVVSSCSLRLTLTTRAQIFFLRREQSEVHLYISKVATKRTLTTLQCGVCGYVFVMLAEHILRRRHLYSIFERVDSRPPPLHFHSQTPGRELAAPFSRPGEPSKRRRAGRFRGRTPEERGAMAVTAAAASFLRLSSSRATDFLKNDEC